MFRMFSIGTVCFEALSSAVLATRGTAGDSLTTQAAWGAVMVLPVACAIAHRILARSGWYSEDPNTFPTAYPPGESGANSS